MTSRTTTTRMSFLLGLLALAETFRPAWTAEKMPSTTTVCGSTPFAASTSSMEPVPASSTTNQDTVSTRQAWDVDLYQKHSFVFEYGSSLVDLLNPQPGEIILDVGCGSGQLTGQIADRGAKAIGVDADPHMIERAKATYPEVEFFEADAAVLELPPTRFDDNVGGTSSSNVLVDAIFSNAALHWVKKADAAVAAMSRVLKPGGRFVIEMGGKGNVERIFQASKDILGQPDQENPWFFPSIAEYTALLEKHGIEVVSAQLFDRPTRLEEGDEGMANWLRMFGGILLKDVSPETKEDIIQKIVTKLREEENSLFDGQQWTADYRRLRIIGRKLSEK